VSGISRSSLIVFAPVRSGAEDRLLDALGQLGDAGPSPFARVPGTHFARWVFIPALTGPHDVPLEADGAFLLMCSDFDTSPASWTAALCEHAGAALAPVMDCWEGFPGCQDPLSVTAFFEAHNVPAGFTVAGYRRATVEQVREALRLHDSLRGLAVRARREHLAPSALRKAWSAATLR
jgi:hypothetical protein